MKKFIILFYLIFIVNAYATTVAFMKVYKPDGNLLQLEKNGVYAHLAIAVPGGWLHSHPFRGVEIINSLSKVGYQNYEVNFLLNSNHYIDRSDYIKFLGMPFDRNYEWDDEKLYCSELIAKILNIAPMPMEFYSEMWGDHPNRGELGISPDEIYFELKKQNFVQN